MGRTCIICKSTNNRLFQIPSEIKTRENWLEIIQNYCGRFYLFHKNILNTRGYIYLYFSKIIHQYTHNTINNNY